MSSQAQDAGAEQLFGDELPKGTELLRGQYRIARFLNAGGFGITYLARDSLDRVVVIKECFPSNMCFRQDGNVMVRQQQSEEEFDSIVKLFEQEARALAKLSHPNIVGVHQVFSDNNTAYMALDFVRGRDLLDLVEDDPDRFTPALVRDTLIRILNAVDYVHQHGMLHRDISPDNILLDDQNDPVLIDFGAARVAAKRVSRVLSTLHTVKDGYSPQEFYLSGSEQGPFSDIYALAATFYHIITGEAPPVAQERLSAVAEHRPDPYLPILTRTSIYDRDFLAAIDQALEIFPKDRLQSAQQWLDIIDVDRREARAKERAETDEALQFAIRALVEETNKIVTAAEAPQRKTAAPPPEKPKKAPLFPDLMGPPPPEGKARRGRAADEEELLGRAASAPVSEEDETYINEPSRKKRLLNRVLNSSLWRLGNSGDKPEEMIGKADR